MGEDTLVGRWEYLLHCVLYSTQFIRMRSAEILSTDEASGRVFSILHACMESDSLQFDVYRTSLNTNSLFDSDFFVLAINIFRDVVEKTYLKHSILQK